MALNTWWDGDPGQRYWMEITDRGVLGEDLVTLKYGVRGREEWSYTLVSHVRPGDRVLHYVTNEPGGPAIVGWSEAIGVPSTGTTTWQARGTAGRERDRATTGPSWYVPLGGFHEFSAVVRGRDLDVLEAQMFQLRGQLEAVHGKPVYFPFLPYRRGEVRAQQGYLAKFPAELLDLIPELSAVRTEADGDITLDELEDTGPTKRTVPKGQLSRIQDPELRSAIENHAVYRAIVHYKAQGATDVEKLGKPYDIKVCLDGVERHVEVKGSSLGIETVELTGNEVNHAYEFQPTDLVVVDGIQWSRDATGGITTSGGELRIWSDWTPIEEDLSARKFAYTLPPTARQASPEPRP